MTDLKLGDKVRITGFSGTSSRWEGREGVLYKTYGDNYWGVRFDDGCEKVWSEGSFEDVYLKKVGPDFKRGDRVEIVGVHPNRGSFGNIISVRTFAAADSTKYVVELEAGMRLNGIDGKYLKVIKPKEETRKFAEGQKVRYIGNGDGVFNHYRKDGTVTGYSDNGSVFVRIDEEPHGTVLHREHDVEALPTEGEKIESKDLKVGMVIRTEYVSESGGYRQVSSKQGTITSLKDGWHDEKFPYAKDGNGSEIGLFFSGIKNTVYILVKDAPKVDPLVEQIEKLGAGSVVQWEDEGGVFTYVRTGTPGEWYGLTNNITPIKVGTESIKQALEVPGGKILVSKHA